jgi:hypothetical protein
MPRLQLLVSFDARRTPVCTWGRLSMANSSHVRDVLTGHENDPSGSALALRLMGAVHRLVLEGHAPELALYYPSVGGDPTGGGLWETFKNVLIQQQDAVRSLLRRPVQTNEVRRARALLGGFLQIVRDTGFPLSLLEVGTSAGLNLRWDHFRYEVNGDMWGDPASPVRLLEGFAGPHPSFDVSIEVVGRRGCDAAPIDPLTPEGHLTLLTYIWPDQVERIALLHAAIQVAARVPASVQCADAPAWLEDQLREDRDGVATVVYHSIVMQYLTEADRESLQRILRDAGNRATPSAPLAWLRMEPAGPHADVHLTMWPGGADRLLAQCGYHGQIVHWLGDNQ